MAILQFPSSTKKSSIVILDMAIKGGNLTGDYAPDSMKEALVIKIRQ